MALKLASKAGNLSNVRESFRENLLKIVMIDEGNLKLNIIFVSVSAIHVKMMHVISCALKYKMFINDSL